MAACIFTLLVCLYVGILAIKLWCKNPHNTIAFVCMMCSILLGIFSAVSITLAVLEYGN